MPQLTSSTELRRHIRTEITRARRYQRPLALVAIDIDGFSKINEEHGRLWGNELLKGFADILSSQVRSTDILARVRADDFVVLMPESDAAAAYGASKRWQREIASWPPMRRLRLTASIGVAFLPETCSYSTVSMVGRCRQALLEAKKQGGNRVVLG